MTLAIWPCGGTGQGRRVIIQRPTRPSTGLDYCSSEVVTDCHALVRGNPGRPMRHQEGWSVATAHSGAGSGSDNSVVLTPVARRWWPLGECLAFAEAGKNALPPAHDLLDRHVERRHTSGSLRCILFPITPSVHGKTVVRAPGVNHPGTGVMLQRVGQNLTVVVVGRPMQPWPYAQPTQAGSHLGEHWSRPSSGRPRRLRLSLRRGAPAC